MERREFLKIVSGVVGAWPLGRSLSIISSRGRLPHAYRRFCMTRTLPS